MDVWVEISIDLLMASDGYLSGVKMRKQSRNVITRKEISSTTRPDRIICSDRGLLYPGFTCKHHDSTTLCTIFLNSLRCGEPKDDSGKR